MTGLWAYSNNNVIVLGVPHAPGVCDTCLGTNNKPSEVGLDNPVKLAGGPPFNSSVVGLSNLVVANSSEPIVGQHSSPSFEIVPDSFDGLENSFNWKENLEDLAANQGIPSNLFAFSSGSIPRSRSNDFLNPAHRRAVRLSVCEALEAPSPSNYSPPFWLLGLILALLKRLRRFGRGVEKEGVEPLVSCASGFFFHFQCLLSLFLGTLEETKLNEPSPKVLRYLWSGANISKILSPSIDFNAYLLDEEKLGGPPIHSSMAIFWEFCQDNNLVDLSLKGGAFTWSNRRDPLTLARLDHFLNSSAGSKKVGALQLLRGVKIAIKGYTNSNMSNNLRKVIKDIESEISVLELEQAEGHGDSMTVKMIADLRAKLWFEIRKEGAGDGKFSANSMVKMVNKNVQPSVDWNMLVWRGLAPPKNLSCPLCGAAPGTVVHLLFTCAMSWKLWMNCAALWNLSIVLPRDPGLFLSVWHGASTSRLNDSI
ncbi:hypothetical protein V6N12_004859 [Hibiscus sabdariffa]|uniref:Reverse transcriptase zinc-binding domain-containing protein n=1 Tax=Hibiscus sabdariffa TaxID=183260 RepID=A0ABR2CMR1_9ROSI